MSLRSRFVFLCALALTVACGDGQSACPDGRCAGDMAVQPDSGVLDMSLPDTGPPRPDQDGDGAPDDADNCPATANPDQADLDGDAAGDACDPDDDGDGVPDETDVCPLLADPDQADLDLDGEGDACDADDDNDGLPDATDNCPARANPDQADTDADGVGDRCDNCAAYPNATQGDADTDGVGDLCDTEVVDNGDVLYVPLSTSYALSGERCYTQAVRVRGSLRVAPLAGGAGTGSLELRAPRIEIESGAMVDARASGYAGGQPSAARTTGGVAGDGPSPGCGGSAGSAVPNGGAGGGYGGMGGRPQSRYGNTYMTACAVCSETTVSQCSALGGSALGTHDGADLHVGSGGGASGNGGCLDGSAGGAGGGRVYLAASQELILDGVINASGEDAPVALGAPSCSGDYVTGGGGGSGGGVWLSAPFLRGGGSALADGGDGADSPGDGRWGFGSGGGGGGRVKIFGDTTGWSGATSVLGGDMGVGTEEIWRGNDGAPGTAFQALNPPGGHAPATCQ